MMLQFLGGAASVWITCLLFFQLMLLAGYSYAQLLERYCSLRMQIVVHRSIDAGSESGRARCRPAETCQRRERKRSTEHFNSLNCRLKCFFYHIEYLFCF